MKVITLIRRCLVRFRYPLSMPEDVAKDLGLNLSNLQPFKEFINTLTHPHAQPTKLTKYMPREEAEKVFRAALRKERFSQNTLFSYHFNGGWMEFVLQFDEQSRLRRMYLKHKDLKCKHEIPITKSSF